MQLANLKVHRRARWILEQIPEADREAVLEAAESLRRLPPARWPKDRVKLLDAATGLYLLSVGPTWRAFLTRDAGGELEISDVVQQGFLDEWGKASQKNGKKE